MCPRKLWLCVRASFVLVLLFHSGVVPQRAHGDQGAIVQEEMDDAVDAGLEKPEGDQFNELQRGALRTDAKNYFRAVGTSGQSSAWCSLQFPLGSVRCS